MAETSEWELLSSGAQALGIELDRASEERMLEYLSLMRKWNRTVNLTAITEPMQMVTHHLLDSLSIAGCVEGVTLLDLGSGAGVPGVPLALLAPDRQVTLLDSRARRTAFLEQARIALALANVTVVTARAEQYRDATFDTVVVRAFGTLRAIGAAAAHLIDRGGRLVAMKGNVGDDELAGVAPPLVVEEVRSVKVPGIEEPRSAVILVRSAP